MPAKRPNYAKVLAHLRSRKLTDDDYRVLISELMKVVRGGGKPATKRRVVAKLPFGMDIVK